ncbi:hypothetical protein BDZ97DRAFT_1923945 [Flammula alnicola]|nr:hypothetical protein BDZ97DRAFT_1923945 [Flammula alnicola]
MTIQCALPMTPYRFTDLESEKKARISKPQTRPRTSKRKSRRGDSELVRSNQAIDGSSVELPLGEDLYEVPDWEPLGQPSLTPTREPSVNPPTSGSTLYGVFLEMLDWDESMIMQLSHKMFVVRGWNAGKNESTAKLYHLNRVQIGCEISIVCLCPSWTAESPCVHERYLKDFGEVSFPLNGGMRDDEDRAFILSRFEDVIDDSYVTKFSVPTPGTQFATIKTRAIVNTVASIQAKALGAARRIHTLLAAAISK